MNILPTRLRLLNRWEFFQLITDALSHLEPQTDQWPESLQQMLSELRKLYNIYDIEIVQERQPDSSQLLEAEEECDYAILTIYKMSRAYRNYKYSEPMQTAANELLNIFAYYGNGREISRHSQQVKAAILINLLQYLDKELPKQHIATLNLTDALSTLQTNTQIFDRELTARSKLRAQFVPGVAKNARMDVQNKFMEMVALINALSILEGEEKYAELKQLLKTIVEKSVAKMRQRTNNKTDEEPDE